MYLINNSNELRTKIVPYQNLLFLKRESTRDPVASAQD